MTRLEHHCGSSVEINDTERQKCEVWTRVMGYHRPVESFNQGKKAEHKERMQFQESCLSSSDGVHSDHKHL